MKNKKTIMIIGAVAVAGIGFYLWNRSKQGINKRSSKSSDESIETEDVNVGKSELKPKPMRQPIRNMGRIELNKVKAVTEVTPSGVNEVEQESLPTTSKDKLSKFEVEMRMLKLCGARPLKKGARRNLYNECLIREKAKLKEQGLISFDGGYEGVVSEEFFNQFDNGWDINL
jgi:hypothetical protein